ncbi:MAG: large-conductance mechanosensitive channel protein MscL [Clostridium sp.]|nr:large-conductance mechanosensitive channel protein MscL [Clostridium sp.]
MGNLNNVMKEFKAFILKGNIIDMAVGVIIGGAFSKIVTSLVNDILMPALGAITGGASFNTLKLVLVPATETTEEAAILYGSFLQNILDFLIIGACMFFMIKAVAAVSARFQRQEAAAAEPAPPSGPTQEELLAEIRDLLKEGRSQA